MTFPDLPKQPNFPELEEKILRFWNKEKVFEKSLAQTKGKPRYVFYDGPATTNGKPHIGHVITRVFKDIVPRYKTMRGLYVLRKVGWDTHGLPVEVEVEKSLGISGKQEIENLIPGDPRASIIRFNELCRQSVWKYKALWETMIRRVGHWIDLTHPYITYDPRYIESVWWALKTLYDKGLLYEGYKVVPYCTRCGTPLSSHEVAQGYEEVEDSSVYVKFPLVGEKNTFFLAWTTTPWTLPGNIALAVDPSAEYVKAKEPNGDGQVIVTKSQAGTLGLQEFGKTMKGSELVGRRYQPIFPWLRALVDRSRPQFEVVSADFVSMEDGTGIVHTAVMYGEEDFALGVKIGLPQRHLVDRNGRFISETGWLAGKYVKDADSLIVHDLRTRGLIFKEAKIRHQYPFCWRCHKPLLYYALESWFVATTKYQDKLIENNKKVNWIPAHLREGRMGDWYRTLIDWCISRFRYWGTPLPIWICDTNHSHKNAIGSFQELARYTKKRLGKEFDPHRPYVDDLTWPCPHKDGGTMRRVPDTIDAWFDAGSMPFAQWHYPFENKQLFKEQFPADYVSEGIDQTRGWWYLMMAVNTGLFGKSPYKTSVTFEHVVDAQGKKMSKHIGNVLDPWDAIAAVGADPIRWFFFTSVTIGSQYRVSIDVLRETVRRFFLIFWNSLSFFVTYAKVDRWQIGQEGKATPAGDLLDRWLMAKLALLIEEVTAALDGYDFPTGGRAIQDFVVNDISTWYIRRSRDRVGPAATNANDKAAFYSTMYTAFKTLSLLAAPFIPFFADYVWRILQRPSDPISVHLAPWPKKGRVDRQLLAQMAQARLVVEEGLRLRKDRKIKVRQPLSEALVSGVGKWRAPLVAIVAEELNVKRLTVATKKQFAVTLETRLTPALKEEGFVRDIIRCIQELRRQAGYMFSQQVTVAFRTPDSKLAAVLVKHQDSIEQATLTRVGSVAKPDVEATVEEVTTSLQQ